jgi:hypothetical protein
MTLGANVRSGHSKEQTPALKLSRQLENHNASCPSECIVHLKNQSHMEQPLNAVCEQHACNELRQD